MSAAPKLTRRSARPGCNLDRVCREAQRQANERGVVLYVYRLPSGVHVVSARAPGSGADGVHVSTFRPSRRTKAAVRARRIGR